MHKRKVIPDFIKYFLLFPNYTCYHLKITYFVCGKTRSKQKLFLVPGAWWYGHNLLVQNFQSADFKFKTSYCWFWANNRSKPPTTFASHAAPRMWYICHCQQLLAVGKIRERKRRPLLFKWNARALGGMFDADVSLGCRK